MKRLALCLLGLLATLGLLLACAEESLAHGGQFRVPGGSLPPGLRTPQDPIPPVPPPPSGGEPPTGGPTPTPPGGTPVPPITPNGPTTGGDPTSGRAPTGGAGYQDWTLWYHHNKDPIENLKRRLYLHVHSDNPLAQIGGGSVTNRGDETRLTQKKVDDTVIPALIWAMDPKNAGDPDVESASYLALAKVARTPDHVQRIRRGLDLAVKKHYAVRESVALALGLLRRASPDDQFSAFELDKVRTELFTVFENTAYPDRTRGFAALAIGLLGDQPTGSAEYLAAAGLGAAPTAGAGGGGAGDAGDARRLGESATTARLFRLLAKDHQNADLPIALLLAIGLQPSTSVTEEQRNELGRCVLRGTLFDEPRQAEVRGHAAVALARVGSREEAAKLRSVLLGRASGGDVHLLRSAAIGLGVLGAAQPIEEREKIAQALIEYGLRKARDDSVKNFSLISLAHLLQADLRDDATDRIASVGGALLGEATRGRYYQRPFAALALGLVVAEITDENEIEAWQVLKRNALTVLREGLDDAKIDKLSRAGFATALGIARDATMRRRLTEIVADRREDKDLRGYSTLALGLIGGDSPDVAKAIAGALAERSSDELRRQAAVALGLLGNPKVGGGRDAMQLLIQEIETAEGQAHKGQVVVALARLGNDRAVDPLVRILKNETGQREQDLTRALACAGLGIVGDLEWIPSLERLSRDINYRLSTDLLNEVLSIL